MNQLYANTPAPLKKTARLLIDTGLTLLRSGAHTERTLRNLRRLGNALGYRPAIFISLSGITLTLDDGQDTVTMFGEVGHHGVHLATVGAISRLSWSAKTEDITLDEMISRLNAICEEPHYPRWIVIMATGLGCGALSRIAGADWPVTAVTILAASVALYMRMKMMEMKLNLFLIVMVSATVACLVSGLAGVFQLGPTSSLAIATSVLFLIPGAPMICSVIDFINGHMNVGLGRLSLATGISFSLALGMLLALQILGVTLI